MSSDVKAALGKVLGLAMADLFARGREGSVIECQRVIFYDVKTL